MSLITEALLAFSAAVIVYYALLNSCYLLFAGLASRGVVRYARRRAYIGADAAFASPFTPPVSVVVPAYNEEAWIVDCVRAVLRLRYPTFEVVVIDDGSSDRTVERLDEAYDLVPASVATRDVVPHAPVHTSMRSRRSPEITVFRKENGGTKADAVNAGIDAARYPYVCVLDADVLLEPDGLLHAARPLLDDPQNVVCTGGIVRISNGSVVEDGSITEPRLPRRRLATLQIIEYFRAFITGRIAWDRFGATMIVSGAFGLFHRGAVESVGGFEREAIGEDFEIVQRLYHEFRRRGDSCRVAFVPEAVAWTEAPEDFRGLAGQRRRWQSGLCDTLWRHRSMTLNPRYGRVGMLGLPFHIAFELVGPFVELTGYVIVVVAWSLGILDVRGAIAFALVALLLGMLQSVAAIVAAEFSLRRHERMRDLLRLIAYSAVENFGYRQWLAYWRLRGVVDVLVGGEQWGTIVRHGVASQPDGPGSSGGREAASEPARGPGARTER